MVAGADLSNPLSVREVSRFYGSRAVLRNASLEVPAKSVVCLFGRSGSGKSTLLNIVAGLVRPHHGAVYMGDEDVTKRPPQNREVGFIFQDSSALFPHLTVEENVVFAVKVGKRRPRTGDLNHDLGDILERTGLTSYRSRKIDSLSGGDGPTRRRQRPWAAWFSNWRGDGAGRADGQARRQLSARQFSRGVWSQASRRFWSQFSRKGGTSGEQVTKSLRFAGIGVSDNKSATVTDSKLCDLGARG